MNEEVYFIREDAIITDFALTEKEEKDVKVQQENRYSFQYFG